MKTKVIAGKNDTPHKEVTSLEASTGASAVISSGL